MILVIESEGNLKLIGKDSLLVAVISKLLLIHSLHNSFGKAPVFDIPTVGKGSLWSFSDLQE